MTNLLPAHSLAENRAFQNQKSGWSTTNGKICTVLVCKNNCKLLSFFLSLSFDIIRVSHLFFLPYLFSLPYPLPRRQHFCEKFFRCPFHSKSAPRNRCPPPPQLFDASYAPAIDIYRFLSTKCFRFLSIYILNNRRVSACSS